MRTAVFPQELIDEIIDQVNWEELSEHKGRAYNKADILLTYTNKMQVRQRVNLANCSLVSRAWLSRARNHLFHHVTLRGWRNPPRFLKLLASSHCTIRPHVQHLELNDGDPTDKHDAMWLTKGVKGLYFLPSVQSLSITRGKFYKIDEAIMIGFLTRFRGLKYLRIEDGMFSSPAQLVKILSLVPCLERLVIRCRRPVHEKCSFSCSKFTKLKEIVHQKLVQKNSYQVPFSLTDLDISLGAECAKELIGWLQSAEKPLRVETLRLNFTQCDDPITHSRLMYAIGASLKNLTLDFKPQSGGCTSAAINIFIPNVEMKDLENLRIIHLPKIFLLHDAPSFLLQPARSFPYLLAKITSPQLEELFIELVIDLVVDVGLLNWSLIETILERSSFSNLQLVQVSVTLQGWKSFKHPGDQGLIEEELSRYLKRRVSVLRRGTLLQVQARLG